VSQGDYVPLSVVTEVAVAIAFHLEPSKRNNRSGAQKEKRGGNRGMESRGSMGLKAHKGAGRSSSRVDL